MKNNPLATLTRGRQQMPWALTRPAGSLLSASLLLVACAGPQQSIIPDSLRPASASDTRAAGAGDDAAARETRVTPLPIAPAAPASKRAQRNAAAEAEAQPKVAPGELASVNLEQVTLGVFAQLVFADILKKNVNVDPQVQARKDLVTFRSGGGQTAAQLENAVKLLLKSYGVTAVDLGGLVRVVPDNANPGNLPEIRRGAALPETPVQLRPVFQLVELRAVRNAEVAGWVRTMFGDRVKLQEDSTRNAVLLSAGPDIMEAVLEAIRVLDQPVLSGVQSAAITPAFWSADELARRLFEVLTAQGYSVQPLNQAPGGARFPIILLPVSGLNAVYVFARGDDVLKHVTEWARTLDKPNERGIGKNFFTYAVKHKDASALAGTLEQLLSGTRNSTSSAASSSGGSGAAAAPSSTSNASQAGRSSAVVVDKSTNMIIFQASQDEYPQITMLLQTLDRPTKTALIEVTVAELQLDDSNQLGVEWLATKALSSGAQVTGGTSGGLSLGTGGLVVKVLDTAGSVRATLNALASDNKATVLSSPRLLARNGETASIQVGDEVPIITSSTTSTTTTAVTQSIQYRNTGVVLKIKPVIHSGDQVDLDVSQEVSSARTTTTGVSSSPTFASRKVDTKVSLRNGTTMLLGGLISSEATNTNAGVPLLKDIPLVGTLFNNKTNSVGRRELIVLITPYVINDDHEAESLTQAFRKMLGPWAGRVGDGAAAAPDAAASKPGTVAQPAGASQAPAR